MKLKVSFIENEIGLNSEFVQCLEIENRSYFYRIVDLLYRSCEGEEFDEIFVDGDVGFNKFYIMSDYFHFPGNNKKITTELQKFLKMKVDENQYDCILKNYRRLFNNFVGVCREIDFPIVMKNELNLDGFIKLIDVQVDWKKDLLDNLLLFLDVNRELNLFKVFVFVNLKQFLSKKELEEFYKYAVYNEVSVLLIDSQAYGVCIPYEKKVIIDENLDEFVL